MRLIDADALPVCNEYVDGDVEYVDIVYKRDLDAAPTIDPVRHGRWIAWNGEHPVWLGCFCSVCKNHADSKFAFCPNCGARMDAEEEKDG